MGSPGLLRDPVRLLWIDATSAATAGVAVLALGDWLSALYRLPYPLLAFIAAMNLLYASYSFSLARRRERTAPWVTALIVGNLAWAGVCVGMAWRFAGEASGFAMLHFIGEAVFVGGLAVWEWRWRARLVQTPRRTRPATTLQMP